VPLGAEHRSLWQPHHLGLHRSSMCSAGDPLPRGDQRVPGAFPHIRQVHRGDPVGSLPRTPWAVPLDLGRVLALPGVAGLIDRPGGKGRRRPA
jgi:hypothetical protein